MQLPARLPVITVPGATISGFTRPSAAGPRLDVELRSSILFAEALSSVLRFSEFPVAIKFFAALGRVSVSPAPELPAEKISMIGSIEGLPSARAPIDRIVFGSHAPYFPVETALLKLIESPLDAQQLRAITQGNARRLLPRNR